MSNYYCGKKDFLICLGTVSDETINSISIQFSETGKFHMDDLAVYARPISSIEEKIDALDVPESDVRFTENRISIKVFHMKSEYLYIAEPYSDGWKAYVDGEEKEILKADKAFMAVKCGKGQKEIILKYFPPYLKLSGLLSIAGIIALLMTIIFTEKRLKKTGAEDE